MADEEFDLGPINNPQPREESFDYDDDDIPLQKGDVILDKPLLNTFFDPEEILLTVERSYKGYQKINGEWVYSKRAIARTVFINKTINMLRSVINPQNYNSKLSPKQIDQILLEKNIEYIEMVRNEPEWSLSDDDCEAVVNIFDHILQTFMGIVENGRISEIMTQIATGTYDKEMFTDRQPKAANPLLNFLGGVK